jgi:hypothetical protein
MLVLHLSAQSCKASRPVVEPSIEFTRLPPAGEGSPTKTDAIEGRIKGAQPGQRIVLFARSGVWWVQPFEARPFTEIRADSTWRNSTHPGSAYAALLVDEQYRPPAIVELLPEKGGAVRAVATVEGNNLVQPQLGTVHFSGYEWQIRQTPSDAGGSLNFYDPANAQVDREGSLHLHIKRQENHWTSAEVSLTRSLGYGSYHFVVREVSHLEPAAVLSISTWDDYGPSREMDIEIGRWGESASKNAQYVVQPYYVPANVFRFMVPPGILTFSFQWEPGRVSFETEHGSGANIRSRIVSEHVFTSGVPTSGKERIRMKLYVFQNDRSRLQREAEVIIEKFEYLP